jgi:glycosyltransferase involved in cell wall biosynthesis
MRTRPPPLRVGMVIGQLTAGGAEGQLRLLCEGLDRRLVVPSVYCMSTQSEPYGDILERADVRVQVIAGGAVRRILRLRERLAADRIELVHAWLFIGNAFAWLAGRAPLVTSARNCKRSGRLLDALNRRAFHASRSIIVNSVEVQRYIEREYDAAAERITVIHNAIDLERFRPRAGPAAGPAPCIAMVGRLVAQKNPLLFVAAAAQLHAQRPDARFMLIGDGPLRADVAAAVQAAGLDACFAILGERLDVADLLRQADLFWLTSDWEGLPNAVIEALACGLPVVATDVGGAGELVHDGQEGFLIRAGDREALVGRSLQILADPSAQMRMRAAARARAEAFGVQQMVGATEAVYERALGGQPV